MAKVLELLSNKKFKITLIVILVVLFGIMILGGIVKNKSKDNNENNQESETTNIEVNEDLKTQLTKSITELSTGPYCEIPTDIEFYNDCLYRSDKTDQSNLSATYRLSSLILGIGFAAEKNIMVGNVNINGEVLHNPHYVDLLDVENEYKRIFGKDETFQPDIVNTINTFTVKYDSTREKFFYLQPEPTSFTKIYVESYESTPTEVVAHVRVGFVTYEMYKYHLYNNKNKEKELITLTRREYMEKGIISDTEAPELPEYKVTFVKEKDSNNLIFKEAQIVS